MWQISAELRFATHKGLPRPHEGLPRVMDMTHIDASTVPCMHPWWWSALVHCDASSCGTASPTAARRQPQAQPHTRISLCYALCVVGGRTVNIVMQVMSPHVSHNQMPIVACPQSCCSDWLVGRCFYGAHTQQHMLVIYWFTHTHIATCSH